MKEIAPFVSKTFLIAFLYSGFIALYGMVSGYDGKVQLKLGPDGIQIQVDGTGKDR